MFTGLVVAIGVVVGRQPVGDELIIEVDLGGLPEPAIGDSIALAGVCCTVVGWTDGVAQFHLSRETLDRTWLGNAAIGVRLNLEPALRAGDPLGGHLVQGHVDGTGRLSGAIDPEAGGDLWVALPPDLLKYCVVKGSIALDGVSLTIAGMRDGQVRIAVIPHTAQQTTLGRKAVGEPMHVEVDVLAKYVERMLGPRLPPTEP